MTHLYFVCFFLIATHSTESTSDYKNYKLDFAPSPRDPRETYPGAFNKDERFYYYHFAPPYEKMNKYKSEDAIRNKFGGRVQVSPERRLEVIVVNLDFPKSEVFIHPQAKKKLQIYLIGKKNKLVKNKYIESPEVPRHVPEVFFLRNWKKSTAKNKNVRPFTYLREDHHYENVGENQNHLHGSDGLFQQVENFYELHDASEFNKQSAHIQNFDGYGTNYPLPPSPVGGAKKYSLHNYDYDNPPAPAYVLPPVKPDGRY